MLLTTDRPKRPQRHPAIPRPAAAHTYVLPLSTTDRTVRRWSITTAASPDPVTLARLFERSVRPAFPLARRRDAEFWWSRYVDVAGAPFHRFGSLSSGAVVARIETVANRRMLILAELLPSTADAWAGAADPMFARLLGGVLGWAAARAIAAAEHRATTRQAGHLLAPLGFVERDNAAARSIGTPTHV